MPHVQVSGLFTGGALSRIELSLDSAELLAGAPPERRPLIESACAEKRKWEPPADDEARKSSKHRRH